MDKLGSKLVILLGLWICLAQGTAVFASNLPALQLEGDPDQELLQTPVSKAAYFEQVEIFEVQPVPQKEQPDLFSEYSSHRTVLYENPGRASARSGLYLPDHRNDLRRQIFPFHFHW